MLKTLLSRLFGWGQVPEELLPGLQAEGIELLLEKVGGSVTYLNYRAPNRRSAWRRTSLLAAVVLTRQRLVVYRGSARLLDVPYDHPLMTALKLTLESPTRLCIAYDAAQFHADRSGTVQLRFNTPQAAEIVELVQKRHSA